MRLVFSSARIENAEAVAKLLADQGIEVRVENGRSFRSSIRGNFSYREQAEAGERAAVWVIRADDQPRARQLLRDAGLLEASPAAPTGFLPTTGHAARAASPVRRARMGLGLIIVAAVALALWLNQFRNPGWDLPERPPPASAPAPIDPSLQQIATSAETAHLIPTPPALAVTLAAREHAQAPAPTLCLSIDGADPTDAALAAARAAGLDPLAASACPAEGERLRVAVSGYRTDGSGSGTVELEVARNAGDPVAKRLEVRRDGDQWQVLRAP
ncbi:DUF2007 domain-containing protein [Luteimonas marina]|uniref:DUF2007 domain-containing protein n=1 Tax=Luteimonas marina TaxID=488485 RepID=A0A5C5U4P8_9GAMM|nr:DUF2007 domain-containing protein [Luteimonas marina]TWT21353.1 DUF2007 domain-containing protein [Luteimonas marina]